MIFNGKNSSTWISQVFLVYKLYQKYVIDFFIHSGIVSSVYQTKQNEENLRSTIRCSSNVIVKRQGEDVDKFETISSSDLVPGDIIALPNGKFEMSCDAVLILGNVIVNEAMLTGESVPELKSPIPKIEGIMN